MAIEIRGVGGDRVLAARARMRIAAALRGLRVGPLTTIVAFVDDDGPKGGPAKRCAITVRVPYRPSLRAEASALTPRVAFDAAQATLERQLERYRERQREGRRRPKKYYVAKRLL